MHNLPTTGFLRLPQIISDTTNDDAILLNLVKASHGTSYSKWLPVIWNNQGILTNQLSAHGLQSNNHHNASQELNLLIEPLGWKIVKRVNTKPNESGAWFIVYIEAERIQQLGFDLG